MSFDGWLDARDSAALERAWATLGARSVQIGDWSGAHTLGITPQAAALLAAHTLGYAPERFAWFAAEEYRERKQWPSPTFEVGHTVSRTFVDAELELRESECTEVWTIRETLEGARGVQHISIDCSWGEYTREGGNGRSMTFVRVFDRSAKWAVSIPMHHPNVWMVGDVDVSLLDLFSQRKEFKLPWKAYDIDAVRGFLAQLTADLDAHFDTSTTWPGGVIQDKVIDNREYNFRVRHRIWRFSAGPFALEIGEHTNPDVENAQGTLAVTVEGLLWGHEVTARIAATKDPAFGVDGWLDLRLPLAQLDATLARLGAIPGIQLGY